MFEGNGLKDLVANLGDKQFLCGDTFRFCDFYLFEYISAIDALN